MNKKQEIYYLRTKIMTDIEQINLLLDFIAYRIENLNEAAILANIAISKGQNLSKNNEKIGILLKI